MITSSLDEIKNTVQILANSEVYNDNYIKDPAKKIFQSGNYNNFELEDLLQRIKTRICLIEKTTPLYRSLTGENTRINMNKVLLLKDARVKLNNYLHPQANTALTNDRES